MMLVLVGVARAGHAQPCFTPLFGVGPANPVHGFPEYYQDSTGLALAPCLDVACDPALELPDPTRPLSFPDNFPLETFYSRAISTFTGPGLFRALYTAALEGSFANGAVVVPGDQIVFTRIRVRLFAVTPGATYTITHPYGVLTLKADATGTVNFTEDIGRIPLVFQNAVTAGHVGPFLQFAAGPVPPAPGLVGTSVAPQTVSGSPCQTDFFRIEGPGLPGGAGVLQTDQFGTIIGRIAHICGNGQLDLGEQCDDGNLLNGDCCSSTCQSDAAGIPCDDRNPCTAQTTCDATGVCQGGVFTTAACNDGNACTASDTCASGVCVGGPPTNCDDGKVCTTESCVPATGCVHTPNTLPCDDSNPCTSTDTCGAGVCTGTPNTLPCNDGNLCTSADTCAQGACGGTPNTLPCNDGSGCTTADRCTAGACAGTPLNCDDGNVCTTDSCSPATGCTHVPNTLVCNDGNPCTSTDKCAAGSCAGSPNTLACSDSNACTTGDTCGAGACVGGAPPNCDDGNPCTTDSCNPVTGCVQTANSSPCDDGNFCTSGDTCRAGLCVGNTNTLSCNDGNFCTSGDRCSRGACVGTANVLPCDDGNPCTSPDKCSRGACASIPNHLPCSDGNACTAGDTCVAGACVPGPPLDCNDANVCTTDSCNPVSGCVYGANTLACSDGNACTTGDTCSAGVCFSGPAVSCDDGNVCTTDSCDPATGCAHALNTLACNDGNKCTTADTCVTGACVGGPPPPCPPATPTAVVEADVTVNAAKATTNFGTSALLTADASPVNRTFLRVRVSGVGTHAVTAAHLMLQVASVAGSNSAAGGRIHKITSCGWDELTLTSKTQPKIDGPVLATVKKVALKQVVDWNVSSAIRGDGVYCFALETASSDNVSYNSREATAGQPSLALTVTPDCGCGVVPVTPTTPTTTTSTTSTTSTTTSTSATTLPVAPVGVIEADVAVTSADPAVNFGTSPLLGADASPVRRSFLRFRVTGVGLRAVASAHLHLQVSNTAGSASVSGGRIHKISDCGWDELTMTSATQPAIDGPVLATAGAVAFDQVVDFDVTSAIPGDGVYCFALENPASDGVSYNSREGTGQHPDLVVQAAP